MEVTTSKWRTLEDLEDFGGAVATLRARDRTFYAEYAGRRVLGRTGWEEVTVNQFRAGASSLCAATLHKMGALESPNCRDCGELDTEDHVLLACPRGAAARLSLFGPDVTVADVLRDPGGLLKLLRAMDRTRIGASGAE